jgi:sulfur carrier protein
VGARRRPGADEGRGGELSKRAAEAPTIVVNDQPLAWREGMTVADVLAARKFIFPLLVVSINGQHVPRDRFADTVVPQGANVVVVHLMSGG